MAIGEQQIKGCNKECSFGNKCLDYVDVKLLYKLTEQFWGARNDVPKLPKQRQQSMKSLYTTLSANFDVSLSFRCILFLFI